MILMPSENRFWNNIEFIPEHPCWEWIGCKGSHGYGAIRKNGKVITAHRLSWEIHFGSIPQNMLVCHKCDNRFCVRPDHLFLGSRLDNNRDMFLKGRNKNQNTNKTSCKNGHLFNEINTYIDSRQNRACKICKNNWKINDRN
jgi:hypothetical protein